MTSHAAGSPVVLEQLSPAVWRVTLSSPQDRNALSATMRAAILEALSEARDAGATVALVRGDERAFSSGYKLDAGVMRPKTAVEDRRRLVEVTDFLRSYRQLPLVTIAVIRGYCIAGGTDLMLASDVALAAEDAQIGVPNVRGLGISLLLPVWSWLLGPQRAKLLALTGDLLTGTEAADAGLVAHSYPAEDLEARAEAIAHRMALMPAELLSVTKHALDAAWDAAGLSDAMTRAAELDALAHATQPVVAFWDRAEAEGLRQALAARDAAFAAERMPDLL